MDGLISFIGDTFGPWLLNFIEAILRWSAFTLVVISLWIMRLYLLIPFAKLFNLLFRFIDRMAMYLVVK
jgi:hypothetical protein